MNKKVILKRSLFEGYLYFLNWIFTSKKFEKTYHFNCLTENDPVHDMVFIFTIAFNNELIIKQQIRLIKKYIKDSKFKHIVADNSTLAGKRELISDICQKEGVGYVSLPFSLINKLLRPSYSNGIALNWVYSNYINQVKPGVFGFLDHDLFPVSNCSIIEKLNNRDFYGLLRDRNEGWYLWAGLCFFKFESVKDLNLNFFPCIINSVYLDTGGSNYSIYYCKYNREDISSLSSTVKLFRGSEDSLNSYHANSIDFIDDCWMHTINGSYWRKVEKKESNLDSILSEF